MISRYQQKRQAIDKLEDLLTQLWNVSLLLWSHKERGKIIDAWNLAFDVKEALEIELEENKKERRLDKMKKVTFVLDEETHKLLKTLAWSEDTTMSNLIRLILTKKVREMAYQKGVLNTHEIKEFINK